MKTFLIYCNACKNPMVEGCPCYECEERAEKRAASDRKAKEASK